MVTGSRISREEAEATAQPQTTSPDLRYVPSIVIPTVPDRERYDGKDVSEVAVTLEQPVSTFSVDVDTGAYSNARRMLTDGQMPPKGAVRTEEFVNYFDYDYADPRRGPFTVNMEAMPNPFRQGHHILRVGVQAKRFQPKERPPLHLTFLVDVSGSMSSSDKGLTAAR